MTSSPFLRDAGSNQFIGGYETFEQDTSTNGSNETGKRSSAHDSHLQIDVTQATLDSNDAAGMFGDIDDDADDISDIETEMLNKSLPSAQLRRMKSVIKPGI